MKIKFSDEFRVYTNFLPEVEIKGATLGLCLESLFDTFPQLAVNLMRDGYKKAKATAFKFNGEYVWENTAIHIEVSDEDVLEFTQDLPEGSNGQSGIMGALGIVVLALMWWNPAGWAVSASLLTAEGALTGAGTIVAGMAAGMALSGIAGVIAGNPNLPTYGNQANSATYSFSGIHNTTAPGTALNVVYGTHRVGGHLINVFNNVIGNSSFLNAQIGLSEGEIECVYKDEIKLNNRKITDYPESDVSVDWRTGTEDQPGQAPIISGSDAKVHVNFTPNIELKQKKPFSFVTAGVTTKIKLRFDYSSRLWVVKVRYKRTNVDEPFSKYYKFTRLDNDDTISLNLGAPDLYTIELYTPEAHGSRTGSFTHLRLLGYTMLDQGGTPKYYLYPVMPWFNSIENTISINEKISYDNNIAKFNGSTDSDKQLLANSINGTVYTTTTTCTELRFTISAPSMYRMASGELEAATVSVYAFYKLEGEDNYNIAYASIMLSGKTKSEVYASMDIPIETPGVYTVKLLRATVSHASDLNYVDDVYVKDVSEIVSDAFLYPHTAMLGVRVKASDQLSGSMPNITAKIDGVKVRVPTNYNGPTRRMVAEWDGTLKEEKEWTNNPVWCLYDLLTNTRYGLGDYFKIAEDKRQLLLNNFFNMAQYCDHRVRDDGTVALSTDEDYDLVSPRFSLDLVIDGSKNAIEWLNTICAVMRATLYYSEGILVLDIARPKPITSIFNMSNIEKGTFSITGGSYKSIPNVYEVQFVNEDNDYEFDLIKVESKELQLDSTLEERKQTLNLIGVTNISQVKRLAKYALAVGENNVTTVSFSTGTEGLNACVTDVIGIQHDVPQWGFGGRVVDYEGTTQELTLSSKIEFKANSLGVPYQYSVKISHKGAPPETYGIEGLPVGTITNVVTLTNNGGTYSELTFLPTKDDIYVIGETTYEVKPFEIKAIKRNTDEKVNIVCTEYNESVYTDSDNILSVLEVESKNYSLLDDPSALRSVSNFKAEQKVYISTTGEYTIGAAVYFTVPSVSTWLGCIVYYSVEGSSNYTQLPINDSGYITVPHLSDGTYNFVATSVYNSGRQNISEALSDSTLKPYATLTVSSLGLSKQFNKGVNGITLDGNPNGTTFVGKDLKVNWKLGSTLDINVDLPADEEEYGVDTALSQSWFSHYVVKVLDSDNTVRRTAPELKTNTFTYTHAENYADGSGVPLRSFEVQVEAVDKLAQVSTPTRIQVNNPVPAALTGFSVTPVFQGFHVTFDPSKEPDIQGYVIHASRTSGFTPSDANLINNGSETSKTYRVPTKGVWYVRAAAYDYYDRADAVDYSQLNYTAEQVVVVAEQQIVPSDLYTDLRVDFMVHEIIFQMVTTTLTWSAGTITRGGTEYSLAAGTLGSAVGCYVIGTLSGGAVTLSLAPVANGIPTLSSGQVILAQTASVPSIDGNYIVYVRQANSVMLEGANIREASIYHAQIVSVDADTITVGVLDAAVVDVVNLNADNIVGGTIDASVIDVTNLNADNITAGGIRGINVNAASHTTKGSYLTQSLTVGSTQLFLHNVDNFIGRTKGWLIYSGGPYAIVYSSVDTVNKKLNGVTFPDGAPWFTIPAGTTVVPYENTIVIDGKTNSISVFGWADEAAGVYAETIKINEFGITGEINRDSCISLYGDATDDGIASTGVNLIKLYLDSSVGSPNYNSCVHAVTKSENMTAIYALSMYGGYGIYAAHGDYDPLGPSSHPPYSGPLFDGAAIYGTTGNRSSDSASAIEGYSDNGYGGKFLGRVGVYASGSESPICIEPSGSASAPTHSAASGTLWVTKNGVLYINKSLDGSGYPTTGTTWQKVAAQ